MTKKPYKACIDRIESGIAVLETEKRTIINLAADKLPDGAQPGDWLIIDGDSVIIDTASTEAAKARIEKLMKEVWED